MAGFFNGHPLPYVLRRAAGFKELANKDEKWGKGNGELFLAENPDVKEHLEQCAHCNEQVFKLPLRSKRISGYYPDDSFDSELYEKHKGKFVEKILAKSRKAQGKF